MPDKRHKYEMVLPKYDAIAIALEYTGVKPSWYVKAAVIAKLVRDGYLRKEDTQ